MTDDHHANQQLTPQQQQDLHDALSDAFDRSGLTFLLRYQLYVDIDQIVPVGANDNEAIYHIVRWIEMAGQSHALINAARDQNPTNEQLKSFAGTLPVNFLERGVDKDVLQKTAREYKSLPHQPETDWYAQLEPYLKWVARQTSGLRLAPLDKSGKERSAYGLSHLFIDLNTSQVLVDIESGNYARSAVAFMNHERQLILLGDPGSGKTTLLRFVALCLSRGKLESEVNWLNKLRWQLLKQSGHSWEDDEVVKELHWSHSGLTPVYIELRNFVRTPFDASDGQAIWQHVVTMLEGEGLAAVIPALQREVQAGRGLFLFDGVDEVPPEQRADVWQAIHAHDQGACGGNRWVATCRQYSFDPDQLPQADIPVQTLQPLNERQIGTFIDNWFEAAREAGDMSATEAQNKANALKTATQRAHLRELADNPMLLTIMALVQTYHGELPEERAMLYQACIDTLLLRWQKSKDGEDEEDFLTRLGVTSLVLEQLMWEIGWTAHRGAAWRQDKADIPESEVLAIAAEHLGDLGKAEQFIEYTEQRAHLLVGRGGKYRRIYTFPHRTFQEYLAACHLAKPRRWGYQARKLAEESDTWRETLNLAAGTLTFNKQIPDKALDGIEVVAPRRMPEPGDETGWRRVWLAAEMLAVVGVEQAERDEEVGRELLPHVRELVTQLVATGRLTPQQRMAAGAALAKIGDERPGVCTLEPDLIPMTDELTFLMGENREPVTVPQPYAIARYPVTNAQFGTFIDDGGYTDKWRHCWSEEWRQLKGREKWTQPRYWDDSRFNLPNQPVVGVSWYEAEAYAAWLAETTGKPYQLPTEVEWERAARHTDGRTYPWGETWQNGIVNSQEAGLSQTTVVGLFPDGAAPCGAHDMSGNVWEWCQDDAVSGKRLKGGSWYSEAAYGRCAARGWRHPEGRFNAIGLRIVLSPLSSSAL
ncbi:MAG: SUMF1/EgtB/PvdO family nonheme iron enzyme [Anaerolineae bacterium]|nr:SUMF1/EgtB/PvdO family nonheme iron enzyme [Anaerolineae bacterium]MCO5194912.1 SUMF1/EgtB/PvdO family nonheme iron enzyme [Anaerolineae bacterium]